MQVATALDQYCYSCACIPSLMDSNRSVNLQSAFSPEVHRQPEVQTYIPLVFRSFHLLRLHHLSLICHKTK